MALHRPQGQPVVDRTAAARGKVLLYAGDNLKAADLAVHADGLVLHGSAGYKAAPDVAGRGILAIDPERYPADRGQPGDGGMFPESPEEAAECQLRAGADWLLAPSRFPQDRRDPSLQRLLSEGREFVDAARSVAPDHPAFVPVVVRFDELADRRWVPLVRDSGLPIATVFAGFADPLGHPEQLAGAIELVQAADTAVLLRCDVSVAGLMALGAAAGAIGTSSSVRHLWLPRKGRGRGGPAAQSLFVPALANWTKLLFVRQAAADPDLDRVFGCECRVCGPGGDVRALAEPGVPAEIVDAHSAAAAVALAQRVVRADDPVAEFRAVCHAADGAYAFLEEHGVAGPTPSGALAAWLDVFG